MLLRRFFCGLLNDILLLFLLFSFSVSVHDDCDEEELNEDDIVPNLTNFLFSHVAPDSSASLKMRPTAMIRSVISTMKIIVKVASRLKRIFFFVDLLST